MKIYIEKIFRFFFFIDTLKKKKDQLISFPSSRNCSIFNRFKTRGE